VKAWKTATYWALFVVLAGWYWAFERVPEPAPKEPARRETLVPAFTDEVEALALERDGRRVRAERVDRKRWKVVEPAQAQVPSDLVAALVGILTDKQEAEVIEEAPGPDRLADFGLSAPATRIEVEVKDGKRIGIDLGRRNPTRTALYARSETSPRVMLVGLNVEYYSDLLYEAAYPPKPN
jgi:hypothetical protein